MDLVDNPHYQYCVACWLHAGGDIPVQSNFQILESKFTGRVYLTEQDLHRRCGSQRCHRSSDPDSATTTPLGSEHKPCSQNWYHHRLRTWILVRVFRYSPYSHLCSSIAKQCTSVVVVSIGRLVVALTSLQKLNEDLTCRLFNITMPKHGQKNRKSLNLNRRGRGILLLGSFRGSHHVIQRLLSGHVNTWPSPAK